METRIVRLKGNRYACGLAWRGGGAAFAAAAHTAEAHHLLFDRAARHELRDGEAEEGDAQEGGNYQQ